LHLVGHHLKLY